jgi:adenosylcobinamide kinase/adenosylcobinamide-phosphate guanylyltransferase
MLILVTGGARSGKSSFAEQYASKLGHRGVYIATAQDCDEEMQARIALHRRQRENETFSWATIEEPFELAGTLENLHSTPDPGVDQGFGALAQIAAVNDKDMSTTNEVPFQKTARTPVILVDCLTLWLSNWLLRYEGDAEVDQRLAAKLDELELACRTYVGDALRHAILVTNEVGYGLVPEYKLGRQFRDVSGIMNQRVARVADQVFLVTAGIPLELNSQRYRFR